MTGASLWAWADETPDAATLATLASALGDRLGFAAQPPERPTPVHDLPVARPARLPEQLAPLASTDDADRARHGLGRSYADVIRGFRGTVPHAPDLVLRPRDEADVTAALEWATSVQAAVVPYGGGTSVVGGVEPRDLAASWGMVVSLDLEHLAGVAEVDTVTRSARIRAGTTGPALEEALGAHDLTLRFYPQSFQRSTLGGWLVTRAAGHFSTRATHIDDLVESVRAVTPAGIWESRRLPASGAGPSPDRWLLGSEGALGVVTEAWVRVQPRPTHRWSAAYAGPDLASALRGVRLVVQAGLQPSTCRALDPTEAAVTGTLATGEAALIVGLEAFDAPPDDAATAIDGCLRAAGMRPVDAESTTGTWRAAFLRAPYLRDSLVCLGMIAETFETAVTWDRVDALVADVQAATTRALTEVCGGGLVMCRTTHAYPDGVAPYFTVLAPARRGDELAQWAEVKAAAAEAILAAGGTVTHHHAIGRDHRPWYDRQRPEPFAAALAAAKRALDPQGVLNPGVLVG